MPPIITNNITGKEIANLWAVAKRNWEEANANQREKYYAPVLSSETLTV